MGNGVTFRSRILICSFLYLFAYSSQSLGDHQDDFNNPDFLNLSDSTDSTDSTDDEPLDISLQLEKLNEYGKTIAGVKQQMSDLQNQLEQETDPAKIKAIRKKLDELENQYSQAVEDADNELANLDQLTKGQNLGSQRALLSKIRQTLEGDFAQQKLNKEANKAVNEAFKAINSKDPEAIKNALKNIDTLKSKIQEKLTTDPSNAYLNNTLGTRLNDLSRKANELNKVAAVVNGQSNPQNDVNDTGKKPGEFNPIPNPERFSQSSPSIKKPTIPAPDKTGSPQSPKEALTGLPTIKAPEGPSNNSSLNFPSNNSPEIPAETPTVTQPSPTSSPSFLGETSRPDPVKPNLQGNNFSKSTAQNTNGGKLPMPENEERPFKNATQEPITEGQVGYSNGNSNTLGDSNPKNESPAPKSANLDFGNRITKDSSLAKLNPIENPDLKLETEPSPSEEKTVPQITEAAIAQGNYRDFIPSTNSLANNPPPPAEDTLAQWVSKVDPPNLDNRANSILNDATPRRKPIENEPPIKTPPVAKSKTGPDSSLAKLITTVRNWFNF